MDRTHSRSLAKTSIVLLAFLATGSAHAQVVQLPTLRFFGLSTTVSVPDRGSAYLGGVSRSAIGRNKRVLPILSRVPVAGRVFGNRAIASHTELSGTSISAYIHDFEALEEELLGRAGELVNRSIQPGHRGMRNAKVAARASTPGQSSSTAEQSDAAGLMSIAELRRQQEHSQHAALAAARQDVERARQLLASGESGVAKVYLQRAAKQAHAELRAEIAALVQMLGSHVAQSHVGATRPNSLTTKVR